MLSSVACPHSNGRAEVAVKTMKRLIMDNAGGEGNLDTDAVQRAVLQYRNTPDPDTKISPAMCVFGRMIRDFIPVILGKYFPHDTWCDTLRAREDALRKRHIKTHKYWSEHTRRLPALAVGDQVCIQNQTGQHLNKWDRTGTVVEVKQHDQYQVKVDGSGRVTLRNRRFLRKFTPIISPEPPQPIDIDLGRRLALTPPPPCTIPPTLQSPPDMAPTTPAGPGPAPDMSHCSPSPAVPTAVTRPPHHPTLDIATPSRPMMQCSTPTARCTIQLKSPSPPEPAVRRSNRDSKAPSWHTDYKME